MRESAYLRALETALHGAGLPYGYSVTVWATGAALISAQGPAKVWNLFLFIAGAAAAYGLLRFLTKQAEGEARSQLTRSPHLARAGAIHVVAIVVSVGAAALIAQISSGVTWVLAPFAQTLLYLGVSCVEMALLDREQAASTSGA